MTTLQPTNTWNTASSVEAASIPPCHHCGEPLPREPAQRAIDADGRAYCCDGCAAAARWIRDANLGDYYRLRTAAAGRVGSDRVDLSVWDGEDVLREHAHAIEGGRRITLLSDG